MEKEKEKAKEALAKGTAVKKKGKMKGRKNLPGNGENVTMTAPERQKKATEEEKKAAEDKKNVDARKVERKSRRRENYLNALNERREKVKKLLELQLAAELGCSPSGNACNRGAREACLTGSSGNDVNERTAGSTPNELYGRDHTCTENEEGADAGHAAGVVASDSVQHASEQSEDQDRSDSVRNVELIEIVDEVECNRHEEISDESDDVEGMCDANDEVCAYDAINEKYGYGDAVDGNDEVDDDIPAMNGVINATAETLLLRERRGKRRYYEMEPLHICSVTGVSIKFMSDIHYWGRKTYITTATSFADAEAELWTSETTSATGINGEGSDGGDHVGDPGRMQRDNGEGGEYDRPGSHCRGGSKERGGTSCLEGVSRDISGHEEVQEDDVEDGRCVSGDGMEDPGCTIEEVFGRGDDESRAQMNESGKRVYRQDGNSGKQKESVGKRLKTVVSFTCEKCGLIYKQKSNYNKHIESCSAELLQGDTLQRALKMAYNVVYFYNEITVYSLHECHPLLAKVTFDPQKDCRVVKRGWGRRPKWGKALGENTVLDFKPQIKLWFDIGAADKSKKLSACRMLKLLQGMNPHRCDLPTENQVRSLVTTFVKEEKRAKERAARGRLGHNSQGTKASGAEQAAENNCNPSEKQVTEGTANDTSKTTVIEEDIDTGRNDVIPSGDVQRSEYRAEAHDNFVQLSAGGVCVHGLEPEEPGAKTLTDEVRNEDDLAVHADTVDVESVKDGEGTEQTITTSTKYRYKMPLVYASYLKELVLADRALDRKVAMTRMIDDLGWSGKVLPSDFQTEDQVRHRVNGVKHFLKKKDNKNKDKVVSASATEGA